MWIERISLKRFLVFQDAEITFCPGLTVVISPNEGGKSSLMRAVVTALYGDATSRRREVKTLRRWGSGSPPLIELRLVDSRGAVTIVRDFTERKQFLFRDGETDPFAKGKSVDEALATYLSFPDENLFLRVCGVRQEQLVVADGSPALGERLEEILGGGWGEATPAQIQRIVEERRRELRRGIDHPAKPANWGPLRRVNKEIDDVGVRLSEARQTGARREELLRLVATSKTEIDRVANEHAHLVERREQAERYRTLQRRAAELREQADGIRRRQERLKDLLGERERIRAEGDCLPDTLLSLSQPQQEEIHRNLILEEALNAELGVMREGGGKRSGGWMVPVSVLLVAGGILGTILAGRWFLLLLAAGIVLALRFAVRYWKQRAGGAYAGKARDAESLRSRRGEWAGARSLEEAKSLLEEAAQWRRRNEAVDIRLEEVTGAVDGKDIHQQLLSRLDDEYGEAAAMWQAARKEAESCEPFRLDADELLRLERAIQEMDARHAELEGALAPLERELAGLPFVEIPPLEEKFSALCEQRSHLERRIRVLDHLLDTLHRARRSVAGFLAEQLPPRAGEIISQMTGGRYGHLSIDPLSLHIEAKPAEGDIEPSADPSAVPDTVGLEHLSQGARDQIYLAVRLALVDLLGQQTAPPVLLDDPLVHFDSERREKAVEIIRRFAEKHQVIFFTCNPAYAGVGERLVDLSEHASHLGTDR
ncbi:MAG: AAA family ATPase [bacterium]|nr:MAG: AAA family ATPase [bacterium]